MTILAIGAVVAGAYILYGPSQSPKWYDAAMRAADRVPCKLWLTVTVVTVLGYLVGVGA